MNGARDVASPRLIQPVQRRRGLGLPACNYLPLDVAEAEEGDETEDDDVGDEDAGTLADGEVVQAQLLDDLLTRGGDAHAVHELLRLAVVGQPVQLVQCDRWAVHKDTHTHRGRPPVRVSEGPCECKARQGKASRVWGCRPSLMLASCMAEGGQAAIISLVRVQYSTCVRVLDIAA